MPPLSFYFVSVPTDIMASSPATLTLLCLSLHAIYGGIVAFALSQEVVSSPLLRWDKAFALANLWRDARRHAAAPKTAPWPSDVYDPPGLQTIYFLFGTSTSPVAIQSMLLPE